MGILALIAGLCPLVVVVVVQSLSCAQLFETPWTASCQASVSFRLWEFAQTHAH